MIKFGHISVTIALTFIKYPEILEKKQLRCGLLFRELLVAEEGLEPPTPGL